MNENNNKKRKEILISVEDLVVEYKSEDEILHAVNGVSFEIYTGETLGLVGETGAGKTTIAKTILRILPKLQSKVKSGEIVYSGSNLLKIKESEMQKIRGNKISMIFQDPMSALNPVMTIGEQIGEAIKLHRNVDKKEAQRMVEEMLEMVGIPGARHKEYPHQFSGGMKQRVIIAIALACSPELLLADEPTTALDVTIQAQVLDMIAKLKETLNMAVLLITHDLGIVAETCDRVAIIYAGEIMEYGTAEEIFDLPLHPYTIGLFGSLPSIEDAGKKRLKPITGMMPNPVALACRMQICTQMPESYRHMHAKRPRDEGSKRAFGEVLPCLRRKDNAGYITG